MKDCYAALGVVHNLWQPIPKEFDDYISRPKGNLYQSLHTAVIGPRGRTLEVQIRTEEMHRQAEYGVAAHWQYKEKAKASTAVRRRRSPGCGSCSPGATKSPVRETRSALDDTIYVLTPQGRVVDLPAGSTPIDFAYALHTDLGHRCRGARVDGHIVTLDTPLASGQRVEIVVGKDRRPLARLAESGARLRPEPRARAHKIRQWFNAKALAETMAAGRAAVEKELRREGATHVSLESLAAKLGFAKPDEMFAAVARDEVNLRQLQVALERARAGAGCAARDQEARKPPPATSVACWSSAWAALRRSSRKCCKPVPPDAIRGFVTRGKGVSIHREDCAGLKRLAEAQPERVMETAWGETRCRLHRGHGGDAPPTGAGCCATSAMRSRARRSTSPRCAPRRARSSRSCASPSTSPTSPSCSARSRWSGSSKA